MKTYAIIEKETTRKKTENEKCCHVLKVNKEQVEQYH